VRNQLTDVDPTGRLEAVHVEPPLPRGLPRDQVQKSSLRSREIGFVIGSS
jgi:hypothetical protein